MALINRVSQLFRADLNAVLDHIEEPEQLLRQAIRDMEDELAASERHIAAAKREQAGLKARRDEVDSSVSELDEQLDLCFRSDKDELARGVVRKKLEARRLAKRLDEKIQANQRLIEEETRQLESNRDTLEGMRQQAELVMHAPTDEASGAQEAFNASVRVDEDEVEIAFIREKASRRAS